MPKTKKKSNNNNNNGTNKLEFVRHLSVIKGNPRTLSFSNTDNGRKLAASCPNRAYIVDIETGALLAKIEGTAHQNGDFSCPIDWSSDDKFLCTGSGTDETMLVWDYEIARDKKYATLHNNTLRAKIDIQKTTFKGEPTVESGGRILGLANIKCSPINKREFTVCYDGSHEIFVIDYSLFEHLPPTEIEITDPEKLSSCIRQVLGGKDKGARTSHCNVNYSPDGKQILATTPAPGSICIYNLDSGLLVEQIVCGSSWSYRGSYGSNFDNIVACSTDQTVASFHLNRQVEKISVEEKQSKIKFWKQLHEKKEEEKEKKKREKEAAAATATKNSSDDDSDSSSGFSSSDDDDDYDNDTSGKLTCLLKHQKIGEVRKGTSSKEFVFSPEFNNSDNPVTSLDYCYRSLHTYPNSCHVDPTQNLIAVGGDHCYFEILYYPSCELFCELPLKKNDEYERKKKKKKKIYRGFSSSDSDSDDTDSDSDNDNDDNDNDSAYSDSSNESDHEDDDYDPGPDSDNIVDGASAKVYDVRFSPNSKYLAVSSCMLGSRVQLYYNPFCGIFLFAKRKIVFSLRSSDVCRGRINNSFSIFNITFLTAKYLA